MIGCSVWLTGCQNYYWDHDCCWVSNEPKVELFQGCGSGRMTIDDEEYEFYTAQSNNATYIEFYEKDTDTENDLGKLLWKADTELKNGKLYLTITIDTISDYEGQTIILDQYPAANDQSDLKVKNRQTKPPLGGSGMGIGRGVSADLCPMTDLTIENQVAVPH